MQCHPAKGRGLIWIWGLAGKHCIIIELFRKQSLALMTDRLPVPWGNDNEEL